MVIFNLGVGYIKILGICIFIIIREWVTFIRGNYIII